METTLINTIHLSEVLKGDRQFRSLIGLSRDDFKELSHATLSLHNLRDLLESQIFWKAVETSAKKQCQGYIGGERQSALS